LSEIANNIVVFPKKSLKELPQQKLEDIQTNMDMMKHYHIQETISLLTPIIFNQLDIAGFGLSDDETSDIKDGALIVESLRSYMCKYYDLYHPFQIVAENVFIPDDDQEDAFRIANNLILELKNPETE
jgi:hypothetical protein